MAVILLCWCDKPSPLKRKVRPQLFGNWPVWCCPDLFQVVAGGADITGWQDDDDITSWQDDADITGWQHDAGITVASSMMLT